MAANANSLETVIAIYFPNDLLLWFSFVSELTGREVVNGRRESGRMKTQETNVFYVKYEQNETTVMSVGACVSARKKNKHKHFN